MARATSSLSKNVGLCPHLSMPENDLAEHCILMVGKFFDLTMADVMRLDYQLDVTNGIKNQFFKRNEKAERKWLKNFLCRYSQISVRTPEGLSLLRAMGFTPQ